MGGNGRRKIMSVISYSDLMKSFGDVQGTAKPFVDDLIGRKQQFDEESLFRRFSFLFFGYAVLLNDQPSMTMDIVVSRDAPEQELAEKIGALLSGFRLSKRHKEILSSADFYRLVRDFHKKCNVENILQEHKKNNGVFSVHNGYYSVGLTEQMPEGEIELNGFTVDLSR